MAAVFESMLVAAALLLVGLGAAGAVWAKANRFFVPPQIYVCRGDIEIPNPVASVPRAAFNEHVWVNSTLARAPMYVDSLNARLTLEEKEAEATAARNRKSLEDMMSLAQKRASEPSTTTSAGVVNGKRPRFMFQPSICRFGASDRPRAPYAPSPAVSNIGAVNLDALPSSATLLLKPRTGH